MTRLLPPKTKLMTPIVVGSYDAMEWVPTPDAGFTNSIPHPNLSRKLIIEVATFYDRPYGFSCLYLSYPDETITCQGWIFGNDNAPIKPLFVREFAILHGCVTLLEVLGRWASIAQQPTIIYLRAGDELTVSRLLRWFNEGDLSLQSAAAPAIAEALAGIARVLPCPLFINSLEENETFPEAWDTPGDPASYNARTRYRLSAFVLRGIPKDNRARIPRIPLTNQEIKERLRALYERDERKVFDILASRGSLSSTIFINWRLTRPIIRQAMIDLSHSRQQQVTLASILTATRFKMYEGAVSGGGNVWVPTQCHLCGKADGPEHLLSHMNEESIPRDPSELSDFLVKLAGMAQRRNPHMSIPLPLEFSGEIELDTEMLWTSEIIELDVRSSND